MRGNLEVQGRTLNSAGFMHPALGGDVSSLGPSYPILSRGAGLVKPETQEFLAGLQRADVTGDLSSIAVQLGSTLNDIYRGISSGMTAFPVRENLEAEAKVLIPVETPVRNLLPRRMGAGRSSAWKQISSLGGGWHATATDQPGSAAAIRAFFSETVTGSQAPAEHTTVYVDKSATYKLLGTFGSITGFAMAAGANYQNQIAVEKANAIRNLMLNEEYALVAGVASGTDMNSVASTAAPWGDGTNSLGFDGLWASIATGNGTPSAQVVSSVGALTLSHIDNQLYRIWKQGGVNPYMLLSGQEILSLVHLAEASGSIIRVQASASADAVLGVAVTGYKHPITGEIVPIYASRLMSAGNMIFGCQYLPDGTPAADVEVLPQVQLPELAPNENIQGYTAQEIAPSASAPHVYPFVVSVYETFRMKGATVFGKSSGVTAV